MGMLTMDFRIQLADGGVKDLSISTEMGRDEIERVFSEISETVAAKRKLKISRSAYSGGSGEHVSQISERWSVGGVRRYVSACMDYGEPLFLFCEMRKTRNAVSEYDPEGARRFGSMAEAGKCVAENWLGVKKGVIKYIEAKALAEDVAKGQGPAELPAGVTVLKGLEGCYVFGDVRTEPRPAVDFTGDDVSMDAQESDAPRAG